MKIFGGKIDINMDTCLESYPCQHKVTIDGVQTLMGGVKIFGCLVENGQEVPEHFKEYEKQYRQDHPLVKSANKC